MEADLLAEQETPQEGLNDVMFSRRNSLAVITLARPAVHNALDLEGWQRLAELFREISSDENLRVVVVRGAGERAFSAGADIREFPKRRIPADRAAVYNRSLADALSAVMRCPVPVLAMIRGLAVGGGCELAAACDLRIASDDARFGIPIARIGVTLGEVEARAVGRLIGSARLKDLLFTGRLLDAEEAFSIGLVDRVVPRHRVVEVTIEMAEAIAAAAPITVRAAKVAADLEGLPPTPEQADELAALTAAAYDGDDLKEGIDAFLNGRPPRFRP
jgi:enoyl-CoA hydratase